MFLKQYTKKIKNPPIRSRWKEKQVALFKCDYCGNEFETSKNIKRKKQRKLIFCNRKCSSLAREKGGIIYETSAEKMLKKYGVKHVFSHPAIAQKRKETMQKLYGVDNASSLQWVKDKKKETSLKHYGVEHPLQSLEVQDKKKKTSLEKYGYEFATQHPDVKRKTEETCFRKYGERNFSLSDEFANQMSFRDCGNLSTVTGKYSIFGKKYYYRSSYELSIFKQIKAVENKITSFKTNFPIQYFYKEKSHKYLVDFYIEYGSNIILIETKNNFLLKKEKTKAKIEAARVLCNKNNWKYILLHNDNIGSFNILSYIN